MARRNSFTSWHASPSTVSLPHLISMQLMGLATTPAAGTACIFRGKHEKRTFKINYETALGIVFTGEPISL
jgi:hypothetical protein